METVQLVEILLVEDSAEDAELTLRTLRKGKVNNPVHLVRDGAEALAFVRGEAPYEYRRGRLPSLIMLDLKMPQVGGMEVVQQLKSSPQTAAIPVIVLTASSAHRDIVQSYNLGITAYLIKPVNIAAFTEVITQVGLNWTITGPVPA